MINYEPDLRVCGIAPAYAAALTMMEALRPDLIIADLCLKGHDGLELLKEIKSRYPEQRVLMLSMHDEALYAPRALRAGASGYVMKEEATETLLTAIHTVLEGGVYLSQIMEKVMIRRLVGRQSTPELDPFEDLSDRELEVFRLIATGATSREIATQLHLSAKTIESHRARIRKKLNLAHGRDLIRYAVSRSQDARGAEDGALPGSQTPAHSPTAAIACPA